MKPPVCWSRSRARFLQPMQLLWPVLALSLIGSAPVSAGLLRITNSEQTDWRPQINSIGQLAWDVLDGKDTEICLWDGSGVRQITDNDQNDLNPRINDKGQVVWERGGHVYLWDGSTTRQLTTQSSTNPHPQINNAGQVVWQQDNGTIRLVVLWDGSSVRELSEGWNPQINNAGRVVWRGHVDATNHIFLWDGASVRMLSTTSRWNDSPQINDAGEVVWVGVAADNRGVFLHGVFLWDGSAVRQIGELPFAGIEPCLSNSGQVAWAAYPRVYRWNGAALESVDSVGSAPLLQGISERGDVAWENGTHIYLWTGSTVRILDSLSGNNSATPQINKAGQVTWAKGGEIYLYTPLEPGSLDVGLTPVIEGEPSTGTLTLTAPAPAGGAVVSLSSSNPAAATVPSSITIPAGAITATFPIFTYPVAATTDVTISASHGEQIYSTSLSVTHVALASFRLQWWRIAGNVSWVGTIALDSVLPASGATLTVFSDSPDVVPGRSITVAGGRSTIQIAGSLSPVTTATIVHLTASYGGVTRSVALQVLPRWDSLTLSATTVSGGSSLVGTLRLGGPAPAGGLGVGLSTNSPTVATVPRSIFIPAGGTEISFPIQTQTVTKPTHVVIRAAAGQVATAPLWVMPVGLFFTPESVVGGKYSTGKLILPVPAPPGGLKVTLTSADTALAVPPASLTVPEGSRAMTFAVKTSLVPTPSSVILTATSPMGRWTGSLQLRATKLLSVTLSHGNHFSQGWLSLANGWTATGTVTLDGPAPPGGATVTLTSSASQSWVAAVPASVTVPAGEASATFPITATQVGTGIRPITASYGGGSFTVTIQVTIPLASLVVSPSKVAGGASATGTIQLAVLAPPGGLAIGLVSGHPTVAVPTRVIVPPGQTSASFPITTRSVVDPILVPIWAAKGEVQTATVWILPIGLSLSPNPVKGGKYVTGTVILPEDAPEGGAEVVLKSSQPLVAPIPGRVIVPAGATTATFAVRTAAVAGITAVTLSASYNGATWSRALTIAP